MSDVPANQLFDAYFTAAPMRAVFSDRGRLQGMLDFEAALARAEALRAKTAGGVFAPRNGGHSRVALLRGTWAW